eukprot:CAMPEP_0174915246 /NCGR_PEP_ID=MMETSP1355-20121228/759_1 /TAXON_ID=464990 /ORGANISM="Hemiselmis tepida, Strain CCMP443" /LENGTH=74 /DNA_ID=CAMNT_0016160103 /DNA_START=437 /DNA_END=661 /DNA_ORIENTATION=+
MARGGLPTSWRRGEGGMAMLRRSGDSAETSATPAGVSPRRGGELKAACQCCGVRGIAPRRPPPSLGSPHGVAVS